jgi:hypothetical protein
MADVTWSTVRWTEARQVFKLLGWPERRAGGIDLSLPPEAFFEALRHNGRIVEAAQFLASALPRWEAIAWAARTVRDERAGEKLEPSETESLKRALLWLQDPSDTRRRAAFEAARQAPGGSPEAQTALAVYFSGGSLAPPDQHPLPPAPETTGRLVGGAVIGAACAGPKPLERLAKRLDEGVAFAMGAR